MTMNSRRNIEDLSADDLLKQFEEPRRKKRKIAVEQLDSDESEDGSIRPGRVSGDSEGSDDEEESEDEGSGTNSDSEEEGGATVEDGSESDSQFNAEDGASNFQPLEDSSRIKLPSRTRFPTERSLKQANLRASGFAELGASKALVGSLAAMSIRTPTEVQAACIPPLLEGPSKFQYNGHNLTDNAL